MLTDGVSGEDEVGGGAGEARPGSVDSSDSEEVLGPLDQSCHVVGVSQRHGTEGVAGHAGPALGGCLLALQPVAGDGRATVVLWLLPAHRHGVHGDVGHGGLLTLTRYRWKPYSTIISISRYYTIRSSHSYLPRYIIG